MINEVIEKYKVFMIMPFLSDEQKEELINKGKDKASDDVKKRKLCENFYKEIITKVCKEFKDYDIEIKNANEINKQKIDDAIIKGIEDSDIFIVDLTLIRPNVMYELGMTHHIDIERTLIITQDDPKSLPFDIKAIRVQKYDSTEIKWYDVIKEELLKLIKRCKSNEFCLGISEYPELMILEKKLKGIFKDVKIKKVAWDNTFEEISKIDKRVDIVIANRDKFDSENRPVTKYIYFNQLISYNSFCIIYKGFDIKPFEEIYKRIRNKKKCIIETLKQLPKNTIVFANENTDHYNSFIKVNNLFGAEFIETPELRRTSNEIDGILKDFIDEEEPCLFVGGIPERINLLKNDTYKMLIEHKDLKTQHEFKKIQQENGIVFHRSKYIDNDEIEKWAEAIYLYYREVFSEIRKLEENNDLDTIDEYLSIYNNSDRVRQFNHGGIKLHITAEEFVNYYLKKRLISLP